jgi:GntR family transcriptional regulator
MIMSTEERDQDPIDPRGYDRVYEVVARRLRRRIEAGELPWHAPIPSEPDLADWYGVSRTTIRRAVGLLADAGVVEVRRGKGTYVTWRPGDASQEASPECAE